MAIKDFQTLYEFAARYWGNASATGVDLTLVKAMVNRAYAQALNKHNWRFLYRTYNLSITLSKTAYKLPDDYEEMATDQIPYEESDTQKVMVRREINQIRKWRVDNERTQQPTAFDVIPGDYSPEVGSSNQLEVYPTPDAAYTAILYYRINPKELVDDADLVIGSQAFYNLVQQMCLAEVELAEDGALGPQNAKIQDILADAIDRNDMTEPTTLGSYLNPIDANQVTVREGTYAYNNDVM